MDFRMLLHEARPRVYLAWAFITGLGFTATHFYQHPLINILWLLLSVIGLGYMFRVMPLRVKQMKYIYFSWLIPIAVGMTVSVVAASTSLLPELLGYLGAFWLLVTAIGFMWNGLFDPPSRWYFIAACVCGVTAAACYLLADFTRYQYLIAAAVSAWSMLSLWLFRSGA